jgi:mannose-1-phosphate guanylyltransferase
MKNICISLLALVLLASCRSVKVHSWMDPAFEGRSMGSTLVLGLAESDSLSRQYESLFAEALAEAGVEAMSMKALVKTVGKITEEELVTAVKKHRCNSILVTRKLSETERRQVVTSGYYPSHYGTYYGYYSHAYALSYNTTYVQSFLEFELETNLYDVKTRQLVWSGRKVVYDDRSDLSNMKGIIKGVVKELEKKGLL